MKPQLSNHELFRLLAFAAKQSTAADKGPEEEQAEIARVFSPDAPRGGEHRGPVAAGATGNAKIAEVVEMASEAMAVRMAAKLNRQYGLHVKTFRRSIIVLPEETGIMNTVRDRVLREIQK